MVFKRMRNSISTDIIRQLQKKGRTLKDIGKLMGLSESSISRVRKGDRSLTMLRLRKLEAKLNVPIPLLLLQAIDPTSVPKELKAQYEALREIFTKSVEISSKLYIPKP